MQSSFRFQALRLATLSGAVWPSRQDWRPAGSANVSISKMDPGPVLCRLPVAAGSPANWRAVGSPRRRDSLKSGQPTSPRVLSVCQSMSADDQSISGQGAASG